MSAPGCPFSITWSNSSVATRASTSWSTPVATSPSTPTTRSKTWASCWAAAWPRRWATSGDPPFRQHGGAARRGAHRSGPRSVGPSVLGLRSRLRSRHRWTRDAPFDPQLAEEFWRAFATAGNLTLHIRREGKNTHHILEASFKAVARSLRDAVRIEGGGIPSTKGTL